MKTAHGMPRIAAIALLAALSAVMLAGPAWGHGAEKHEVVAKPAAAGAEVQAGHAGEGETRAHGRPRLAMPMMNPVRGRTLFVTKACFACHAINGVGGHDATALDAHSMDHAMNPFDFAAKMWRMAPYMISAQEEALGEQIVFTGDELADIIAFVHDDDEQHHFTLDDIAPEMRKLMHHNHGGEPAHQEEIGHDHEGSGHHDD